MKGLALLIIFLLLTACPSKPYMVEHTEEYRTGADKEIYVVSHGWHTGIVVPAEKILSTQPQLRERFGNTPYIEFGWGDKMFYQATKMTTGVTLRAILWPTESVIHAVAIPEKATLYFPNSHVEKLCLSTTEFTFLLHFIANSFHKNEQNDLIQLKHGIYGNSQFYQGEGSFYFMNTCNKWTAKALKSAGMDISPAFHLTANSIMEYLVDYKESQTTASTEQTSSISPCR